jgi:hypothetical protein
MKNRLVSENNFLFLDLAEAISHLNERILRNEQHNYLMIVLSEEAMSVANQIAKASGIKDVLSFDRGSRPATRPTSKIQFNFNLVKESGRDLPQDFVFHEERNLKAKMISRYRHVYKEISSKHVNRAIILVDSLTNGGFEFRQGPDSLDENKMIEINPNKSEASNVDRQFVYLHLIEEDGDGINIIIEEGQVPSV